MRLALIVAFVVLAGLFAWSYVSMVQVQTSADALATSDYQRHQALLVDQSAQRMASLLRHAAFRLELAHPAPGADPRASAGTWLADKFLVEHGAALMLHDRAGHVIAVSPGVPAARRAKLRHHRHEARGGAWSVRPRNACPVCLTKGGMLSLTRPLPGYPNLLVSVVIDQPHLYRGFFSSLVGDHDAYIWIMRNDRTIIASPDPAWIGTRPFEALKDPVRASIWPVLTAMMAGRTGQASYLWRERPNGPLRTRLIAYTAVPGREELVVAYSANRSSILARTDALHRNARITQLALMMLFGVAALVIAVGGLIAARRQRQARLALEAAHRKSVHLAKLFTVGTLTASIGHEIKNPLQVVMLNLDLATHLATEEFDVPGVCSSIERARAAVGRVKSIVTTLGQMGRRSERWRTHDMSEVINSALAMAAGHLRQQVTLVRDLETPLLVEGAAGELSQVLLNVLVNAAQACTEGDRQGRVIVRSGKKLSLVWVEVEDDGPAGITEEVKAQLFEPFYTTKDDEAGSGLGLAISAEIVERHGGTLSVESCPGSTVFRLELPGVEIDPQRGGLGNKDASVRH